MSRFSSCIIGRHYHGGNQIALAGGDFNRDSDVDGADLVVWQTNFPNKTSAGIAPVPEPDAVVLWLSCVLVAALLGRP